MTEENISWARNTYDRLEGHTVPGGYSNYLADDEKLERVKQIFGNNFGRLQALKDRYDPTNIFKLNQNIPPTS
jgi:FAD/FMN-containing dehydrogenase